MKKRKMQLPNLHLHLLDTTCFFKSLPSMAFIVSFLLFSLSFTAATALSGDSAKLLSFKSTLPNPRAVLPDWLPGKPPCLFTGVSCSSSGHILSLDLTSLPLSADFASVSAHLFVLDDLTSLKLASTNLSGSLRPLSSCSPSLSHIDLSSNSLSGSPSLFSYFSNCRSLSALNLSSNRIDSAQGLTATSRYSLALQTLDLSANRLVGGEFLPWLLSTGCAHLGFLSLRANKLEGSFSLDGCDNLQHFDVSGNNFSTPIPGLGGCAHLTYLDLSSNKFSGLIGDGVAACEKLSYLNLSCNHFLGPIPALPTSSSLEFLYLAGNHFEGGIHGGVIEACTSLVELDLSLNLLSGNLPTGIESCSSLELLSVSNNNLSGKLPIDVLMKLSGLRKLDLSGNSFVGVLPESLSVQSRLETLDLSSNNISGGIPSGFCQRKTSLKELYLQDNFLTGPIPPDLANCSQLVSLDLSFNYLNGEIPPSLGFLPNLKDLILLMNSLEGEIPQELMNIGPLENLILDYNKLTGNIPSGLRNCAHLHWISLSSNQLSGVIPSWIGGLDKLAILKLSNNSFYGNIPPELGDCKSLLWLDLHTNLLNGTIPPSLPEQSGKLDNTFVVGKEFAYLKNNDSKECHGPGNLLFFAGIREGSLDRIPNRYVCNFTRVYKGITQPSFQHNGSMLFLGLSRNMLEGNIPKEIGSMSNLFILDLSHNALSGPIPSELEGLESVNILDLSYNHLSGQIPQSLTKLTLLNELDLSNNNLTGLIPDSGQFETFPASRFFNNSGLCGYPLTEDCHNGSSTSRSQHQRRQKQGTLIGSVAMGLLFSFFCIFGVVIVYVELKKRRKKLESTLGEYPDGNSNSGNHQHTGWKFTSTREALSINLATFEKPLWRLTFADLMEATNGFHNDAMIGSGGFGDVYKAKLKDGSVVAIKKLIHMSGQGDREFTAEMETIGKVKHKNLVPLLGYCKVGEERLLVYEYMKHGSLEDVLHDRKKAGIKLSWVMRRKIAVGAAKGLSFLHHNCTPHIIHRDMKSSNVLIDENFEARVSDFGMARLMSTMDTHLSVSTLAGTPGYVPPEYYQSFRCSTKGDVYSYGVVLLELLTGRQPTDSADFGDNNLVGWVKQHAKTRISDVFDPELMKEDPSLEIELLQHLKVACDCLDDRPWKRPSMIQVMAKFKEIQAASGLDNSASTIAPDDGSFTAARSLSKLDGVDMSMTEIPEADKL